MEPASEEAGAMVRVRSICHLWTHWPKHLAWMLHVQNLRLCLGVNAQVLKDAGFNLQHVKVQRPELKGVGFIARQLKDASFSAQELKDAGWNARQSNDATRLWELALWGYILGISGDGCGIWFHWGQ